VLDLDRAHGLRIFWARRAVQMCIGSAAKLISRIVAEERIGGMHLADFTTVPPSDGTSTVSCAGGTAIATGRERACFGSRLY
jgi:hypothetical protein